MPNPRRRLALSALTAVFILAGGAAAGWWRLDGRWHTSTDDAYVQGNLVQLTPQIAGIVIRINADDTALVREGDPVVVLDDADTRTALDEAKAGLAEAVRRVRQLYANTDALRANVELRRAEWRRAREDLQRRTGLPDARALALLPPQNATGNWIKIVQRLPVRIRLDPQELATHPLRVGLSMNASIDTHDRGGPVLASIPPTQPVAATQAYERALADAGQLEREIVQANLGADGAASAALAKQ